MLDELNEFLRRMAEANLGANHGPEYRLYKLPAADSLRHALDQWFSRIYTSNMPPQPAASWGIRTIVVDEPELALRAMAQRWFYEQEYSPRVPPSVAAETVADFVTQLQRIVGEAGVFNVRVSPPRFLLYECAWEDVAFDGGDQRWLLHLGFSD